MAVVRWTFYDPLTDTTYTWPVNPTEGGLPQYEKTLTEVQTTAPGDEGRTIIFEGADVPVRFEISGTILEQAQYDAFVEWFRKRHQIRITDDLGNSFWVYISAFLPRRRRGIHHPWLANYTLRYTVLDVA